MALLILGLVLWFATHLWKPAFSEHRATIAAKYGENAIKGGMAVATLLAVVLMVIGYQNAPYIELWGRPSWTIHVNNLLMVLAFASFTAGAIPGHVRHWIRHPQLTAAKLWAVAHLLPNGYVASVILFGGILAWAVMAMISINKRDGKGAKPGPGTIVGNLIHAGATVGVFLVAAFVHNWAGVWPYPG